MPNKKETREWINTAISVLTLLLLAYGTIRGINELNEINVNLNDFTASTIKTNSLITNNISSYCPYGGNYSYFGGGEIVSVCNNASGHAERDMRDILNNK